MKKLFFLFFLPLWGLGGFSALASVTVTLLSTDFANQKVTFRVEYANAVNNRAWIWIDLCPVSGVTPTTFQTAVSSAASATGNNGLYASTNTRGFFVPASPATVTATLSNVAGKFNWCAYGSDVPPTAVINAAGGYTLKGTPPFTINGTIIENTKTFGAGTCITSISDLTGNPDGIVPALPSLSSPNSPSRCSAGAVTLSVTRSGGTTTAMTYTWNIGGTPYTNQTNSYTTGSLSASTTYSVKVKNANNCESNTVNGSISIGAVPATPTNASSNSRCGTGSVTFSASAPAGCTIDWYDASTNGSTVATGTTSYSQSISTTTSYYAQSRNTTTGCTSSSRLTVTGTVNQPGNNGQAAHATCGCASGTTNCSGTCKTTGTSTTNDGACTANCHLAYVQLRDTCGEVTDTQYSSYENDYCTQGCLPTRGSCTVSTHNPSNVLDEELKCVNYCYGLALSGGYSYYNYLYSARNCWCGQCN
jgi:hypothetical protein